MTRAAPQSPKDQPSFMSIMLTEMGVRMGLVLLAMVLAVVGSVVGRSMAGGQDGWPEFLGALGGIALGLVVYAIVMRRFNARPKPAAPASGPPTQ